MIRSPAALAALLSLVLGSTTPAFANEPQEPADPPWYQVELFIFAQRDDNLMAEFWDERTTTPPPAANTLLLLNSDEDPATSPRLHGFPPESLETPSAPEQSLPLDSSGASTDSASTLAGRPSASGTVSSLSHPVDPSVYDDGAFRLLERGEWQLPVNEGRFGSRGYHPLFHAAWRQPVLEPNQSPRILITSEERLADGRPALSGTVAVSINRYLHLTSDLYYRINPPLGWISMRPKGPDEQLSDPGSAASPALPAAETPSLESAFTAPELITPEPQVLTLRLQQSRRMRSDELHYIDHPMLGVLVRITPYERPIPEPDPLLPTGDNSSAAGVSAATIDTRKDEKN